MKSVLVTGGSGGIGSAICKELAKRGYFVGVHYNKNRIDAENLAKEIGGVAIGFDLRCAEEIKKGVEKFVSIAGGISALVNNAGVAQKIQPLIDTTEEEFDKIFSINVKGVFLLCKYTIPYMLENGGSITNISSMWGLDGASCEGVYSASKFAIHGFTRSLAKEYSSAKIRVNAIAPGFIDTKMNASLSKEDKELVVADIPLGRAGTPDDIAKCVAFVIEDASYMTGAVVNVSGGSI